MCNEAICIHGDMEDDVTDLFGPADDTFRSDFGLGETKADYEVSADPLIADRRFYEPCKKCNGSGRFVGYTGRVVGNCFTCKGAGKIAFKTSSETREAKSRAAGDRKAAAAKLWAEAYPDEMSYMGKRGFKSKFYADLCLKVINYGGLTEAQLNAVRADMARDQLRVEQREQAEAVAPELETAALSRITESFQKARENLIMYPKMRLDAFIFSLAVSGKNEGSIYVKRIDRSDDGERQYLGKITNGRFFRHTTCTDEDQQRIIAAASDPEAAATAYGQRVGKCSICGSPLTAAESIERAIGPICYAKYF